VLYIKKLFLFCGPLVVLVSALVLTVRYGEAQIRRHPVVPKGVSGDYYAYIKTNLTATKEQLNLLSGISLNNSSTRVQAYRRIIEFAENLKLSERTSLNNLVHAMMTFGPDKPVYLGPDTNAKVTALRFLQKYYDYLPPEASRCAPEWIQRIGNEYFVTLSFMPRVLFDHLGQFLYSCALINIPLDAEFQLKSGDTVSLGNLLKTEIKYADPNVHYGTWQVVALAYYMPNQTWKNVNNRSFSALDFLDFTSTSVTSMLSCSCTHQLISSAYAISFLEEKLKPNSLQWRRLQQSKKRLQGYIKTIQQTLSPDGMVSVKWYLGQRQRPKTREEVIICNGHILEFLAVFLDKERLREEWIGKIADRFCLAVVESLNRCKIDEKKEFDLPFEYAALCHGVKGLKVYCQKLGTKNIERSTK